MVSTYLFNYLSYSHGTLEAFWCDYIFVSCVNVVIISFFVSNWPRKLVAWRVHERQS